jgi:hypothetical protein
VLGHRDVSSTACPGPQGYAALPDLRDRIRELTPPAAPPSPFGTLEVVAGERPGVRVGGWVVDPDGGAGSDVVVSVDGREAARFPAGDRRDDVWERHPPYGPHHGFLQVVPAAPGPHEVCVTALNRGGGSDLLLGCRPAVVPVPPPLPAGPRRQRRLPGHRPARRVHRHGRLGPRRAVDCAVWWEVAAGVSRTSYAPVQTVTRAQMASFLARLVDESGGTLPDDAPPAFDDVDPTASTRRAIDRLAAAGSCADADRGSSPRTRRDARPDGDLPRGGRGAAQGAGPAGRRGLLPRRRREPHEASIGRWRAPA